jgi:pimeloyl-ACP methyl ester carboxylesterase
MGVSHLFVPGFGSRRSSYLPGLPDGVVALQPPPLGVSHGSLQALTQWLLGQVAGRARVTLSGHSMGGALAMLAAAAAPTNPVDQLVLVSPAGLPLSKPFTAMARDTLANLVHGIPPPRAAAATVVDTTLAPLSALRLARALYRLDLGETMARIRALGVPTTVIGCSSDTLVPGGVCREIARRVGATYREVETPGGHVWPVAHHDLLAHELRAALASRPPAAQPRSGP